MGTEVSTVQAGPKVVIWGNRIASRLWPHRLPVSLTVCGSIGSPYRLAGFWAGNGPIRPMAQLWVLLAGIALV